MILMMLYSRFVYFHQKQSQLQFGGISSVIHKLQLIASAALSIVHIPTLPSSKSRQRQ